MTVWRSCNEAAQIQTISPDGPNPWIHWIYFTYPFWKVCRERWQKEGDGQTCCLPAFNVLFFSLITKTKSDFCFHKNATVTIISEQQLLFVAQNYFCFFPTSHIWEHRGAFQDGWTCFQIENLTGPGELLATKKRLYVCEDWVNQ